MERAFRETQYKLNPNKIINGAKEITPKIVREQEKDNHDLCKLQDGEIAYKDIQRIEALARRTTKKITREVFEKNILPLQAAANSDENQALQTEQYTDYDLWIQKKNFESQIKQDMLEQVLQDYEQEREKHMHEQLKEIRKKKEDHQQWFQMKRAESIRRKQAEENKRQQEINDMNKKR